MNGQFILQGTEKYKAEKRRTEDSSMANVDLKGRNFLKLLDFTPEEILYLIDLAADLKKKKKDGVQECSADF